jgi:ABC-type sugar transport system ATPase subunit
MASASLKLSGITKRYLGVLALDHVDFECAPGEIHAVLGENGSGKSTLLGIASGATEADEGRVTILGKALAAADPLMARQLGLAIVYQDSRTDSRGEPGARRRRQHGADVAQASMGGPDARALPAGHRP